MLAFCIFLYTNAPLRFSSTLARHWRSRIALLLAYWTPTSTSAAMVPLTRQENPPPQIGRLPAAHPSSKMNSPTDSQPTTTKPLPVTNTSLVKPTPQETQIRKGPHLERGGGRGREEGKRRVRRKPDKERPITWRKKTPAEQPCAVKRKRTQVVDPIDVSEQPHRKQKKFRQALIMSAFLRE